MTLTGPKLLNLCKNGEKITLSPSELTALVVKFQNEAGETPLYWACANGDLKLAQLLMFCPAQLYSADQFDRLPFYMACREGHVNIVRYLFEEWNMDANYHIRDGFLPLYGAAAEGRLEVVQYLLTCAHALVNKTCKGGKTALYMACSRGHLPVVQYLMEQGGANPLLPSEEGGLTPLHAASNEGHADIVRWMVDFILHKNKMMYQTIMIDSATPAGVTPLGYACDKGHVEIVRYLIESANCNPLHLTPDGIPALLFACEKGRVEVVAYLLDWIMGNQQVERTEKSTDKSTDNNQGGVNQRYGTVGHSALTVAAQHGQLAVVRYLVEQAGASVTQTTLQTGESAFLLACSRGHVEVARYLFHFARADPAQCNRNGCSPLYLAAQNGHLSVVQFLVEQGKVLLLSSMRMEFESKDDLLSSCLFMACQCGHTPVVRYILQLQKRRLAFLSQVPLLLQVACQQGHLSVVQVLVENAVCGQHCAPPSSAPTFTGEKGDDAHAVQDHKEESEVEEEEDHTSLLPSMCCLARSTASSSPSSPSSSSPTMEHSSTSPSPIATVTILDLLRHRLSAEDGLTLLHVCCQYGREEILQYLLTHPSTPRFRYRVSDVVNTLDAQGLSPLIHATLYGYLNVVQYLLEHCGARYTPPCKHTGPLSTQPTGGPSPLFLACQEGHLPLVLYFIQKRYETPRSNRTGSAMLQVAIKHGHYAVVRCLLEKTSTLWGRRGLTGQKGGGGGGGLSSFFLSSSTPAPTVHTSLAADQLQQYAYSHEKKNKDVAFFYNSNKVNILNRYGDCALHLACEFGHLEIVELLLNHTHADPSLTDDEGHTALEVAVEQGHLDIVKCFFERSRNERLDGVSVSSLLDLALDCGHLDIVDYLRQSCGAASCVLGVECD